MKINTKANRKRKPPQRRKIHCPVDGCDHTEWTYRRLDQHMIRSHTCLQCGLRFLNLHNHNCQVPLDRRGPGGLGPDISVASFVETKNSQGGIVKTLTHINTARLFLVEELVTLLYNDIVSILEQALTFYSSFRVQFTMYVYLIHERSNDIIRPVFNSPFMTISHSMYIEEAITRAITFIIDSLNVVNERQTGWSIMRIHQIDITVAKLAPLKGGAGQRPASLKSKHGLLDLTCPADSCFIYAFLASMHYKELSIKHNKVWWHYNQFKDKYDFSMLSFPVNTLEIRKFEKKNSVGVGLFTHEKGYIYPMHVELTNYEKRAPMLFTQEKGTGHYLAITDFDSLLGEDGVKRHHHCLNCLCKFSSAGACSSHMKDCALYGPQVLRFPPPGPDGAPGYKAFNNYYKTFKMPWVMYLDLETLLEPLGEEEAALLGGMGKSTQYKKKIDCMSYGVLLVGPHDFHEYRDYAGANAMEKCLRDCLALADFALEQLKVDFGMPTLTREQQRIHDSCEICPCCQRNFAEEGLVKVVHHLHHLKPENSFAGSICAGCNLQLKNSPWVPVVVHAGGSFDFHEVIKNVDLPFIEDISIIPRTGEKFCAITINNRIRFIDSFSKLPSSLASLVNLTRQSGIEKFKLTCREFANCNVQLNDLLKKQVNCYDYYTSLAVLEEQCLPSKEHFFNLLHECELSDDDYNHAQHIWRTLQFTSMRDYLLFYQKLDVFLLCDVVTAFTDEAFARWGLDAMQYLSGPQYSFDCLLYRSGSRFQHMNDVDLYRVLQRSVQGGIVHLTTRYIEANLPGYEDFNPNIPASQILYYDATSLYPFVMCQKMYASGFAKLSKDEIERLSANDFELLKNFNVPDESMFVIVDFKIKQKLHDFFQDYPPGPTRMKISKSMLSKHQIEWIDDHESDTVGSLSAERLVLNLLPKYNYAIYLPLLQYYAYLGVTITKLHSGYKCRVNDQVRPYMEENLETRKNATDPITKQIVKIQMNSCFGFSIRARDKDVNVKIAKDPAECLRLVSHPCFKSLIQIKPNLTVVLMRPHAVTLDLPYAIGACVLSLSKLHMYKFVYSHLKPLFHDRMFTVAYTDTDALLFWVTLKTGEKNIYQELKKIEELFDFSDSKDPEVHDGSRRMIPGTFKNEYPHAEIKAFCGLNAKCYALKSYEPTVLDTVKSKGTCRYKLKELLFSDYYNVLMNQDISQMSMNMIRSKSHQLYIVTMKKVSLSALNTKVFYTDAKGIKSLPYGHYRIKRYYN